MTGSERSVTGSARSWAAWAVEALAAQARLGTEFVQVAAAVTAGNADRTSAARTYLTSARREGEHLWWELSRLGLDYAQNVVALGTAAGVAVAHDVDVAARPKPQPARAQPARPAAATAAPPGPRREAVTMEGTVGGAAETRVLVINRHRRARRVVLTPGPLAGPDPDLPVEDAVHVSPSSVTLQAGEEKLVTVTAELDPSRFAPGAQYAGEIEVSGGDEAVLELVVSVVDP